MPTDGASFGSKLGNMTIRIQENLDLHIVAHVKEALCI